MRQNFAFCFLTLALFSGCSHDPQQSFKARFTKAAQKETAEVDEWPDPDEKGFRLLKHRVDLDTVTFDIRPAPSSHLVAVAECQIETAYGPRVDTPEQAKTSAIGEWKKGTGPTLFRYVYQDKKWILTAIERYFDNPHLGMNGWMPIEMEDDLVESLKLDGVDLRGKTTL
jgi:hypothetical protein